MSDIRLAAAARQFHTFLAELRQAVSAPSNLQLPVLWLRLVYQSSEEFCLPERLGEACVAGIKTLDVGITRND
jgi:hypothetical protein